ncbi:MAG: FlgD immunoglobulin-like domain containing protein [bacterium]
MWNLKCILVALCALCGSGLFAQPYRCDWAVVGSGGGTMTGTAYRVGATAGQTAAGALAGAQYHAFVGFWQADAEVGILDREGPALSRGLETRLEAIAPNPFRAGTVVRYALGAAGPVSVTVHDLSGRQVRVLASGVRPAGRYSVDWRGEDDAGRELANGVYFCRFAAGETRTTQKLVLAR